MRIPRALLEEMIAHAREDDPNECCGMIGGNPGDGDGSPAEAVTLHRAANAEASPLRYSIAPDEQFRLMKEIEEAGEELVSIYHSHTRSAAYPSQTDVNLAGWPDAVYLIVSLENADEPYVKGFWIREGEIEDAEIEIV